MKTAISLPDDLFAIVDKYASESGLTRSALCVRALKEYIKRHCPDNLTDSINKAINESGQPYDGAVTDTGIHTLRRLKW